MNLLQCLAIQLSSLLHWSKLRDASEWACPMTRLKFTALSYSYKGCHCKELFWRFDSLLQMWHWQGPSLYVPGYPRGITQSCTCSFIPTEVIWRPSTLRGGGWGSLMWSRVAKRGNPNPMFIALTWFHKSDLGWGCLLLSYSWVQLNKKQVTLKK